MHNKKALEETHFHAGYVNEQVDKGELYEVEFAKKMKLLADDAEVIVTDRLVCFEDLYLPGLNKGSAVHGYLVS